MSDKVVKRKNLGIALGGGAARGWAHIGVLQVLKREGIDIDIVAGTSIGALVGAVYCAGWLDEFALRVANFDWKQILAFFDPVIPKSGLIDGRRISDFVRHFVKDNKIEDFTKKFAAVCTDVLSGEEVVLHQGNVIEAVRASISLPGIFTPLKLSGRLLVDGGLVNPVPVSVARQLGADIIIAVSLRGLTQRNEAPISRDVSPVLSSSDEKIENEELKLVERLAKSWNINRNKAFSLYQEKKKKWLEWNRRDSDPNIFEILVQSLSTLEMQLARERLKHDPPHVLVEPEVDHISFMDYHRGREVIEIGQKAMEEKLPLLKKILQGTSGG